VSSRDGDGVGDGRAAVWGATSSDGEIRPRCGSSSSRRMSGRGRGRGRGRAEALLTGKEGSTAREGRPCLVASAPGGLLVAHCLVVPAQAASLSS
jgi:hypothetical protein